MNKELKVVMNEETADCVIEVLQDWVDGAADLGGKWYGTDLVQSVVDQIKREKERFFPDS